MKFDLVIREGTVASPTGCVQADIGISDGKIVALADRIDRREADAAEVVNAAGKLVLPGVIDAHTHMEHGSGSDVTVDDFENGSKAAAAGGVTTFMDFVIQKEGRSIAESFALRNGSASRKSVIDYSFHIALMDVNEDIIAEIPSAVRDISSSFKVFMTYRKLGFMLDDDTLLRVMDVAGGCGGMVIVHAENDAMVEHLTDKCLRENKLAPIYHAESRPNVVEAEAVHRVIQFSRVTGCPVFVFHVSSREAMHHVREARSQGLPIQAETNPHYLLLNRDRYEGPQGENFIMTPPLRSLGDSDELWVALRSGVLQTLSTDHCPYHKRHKAGGKTDFTNVSPGIPGIELLLPLIYSEGVRKGRISIERMVQLLCSEPARIFGLAPAKGSIQIGADADIAILNPEEQWTVDPQTLLMNSDYSPFEGFSLTGKVEATLSRGRVVFRDGRILAEPGSGRYLYR